MEGKPKTPVKLLIPADEGGKGWKCLARGLLNIMNKRSLKTGWGKRKPVRKRGRQNRPGSGWTAHVMAKKSLFSGDWVKKNLNKEVVSRAPRKISIKQFEAFGLLQWSNQYNSFKHIQGLGLRAENHHGGVQL